MVTSLNFERMCESDGSCARLLLLCDASMMISSSNMCEVSSLYCRPYRKLNVKCSLYRTESNNPIIYSLSLVD